MKRIIAMMFVLSSMELKAELNVVGLLEDSGNNNKEFRVNNGRKGDERISFNVKGLFKGEPAGRPIHVYPYVKCGKSSWKSIDMARFLIEIYGDKFVHYVGAPVEKFPTGVVQVCSLEAVNFDSDKLMISFFDSGANHCNRRELVDFLVPLAKLCD